MRKFTLKIKGDIFVSGLDIIAILRYKAPLRIKVRELFYELKYMFQRAIRGYDDKQVFSLNDSFIIVY